MRIYAFVPTLLLTLLPASTLPAGQIWMRRSEVLLAVDGDECIARAFRSLRAEGFTPDKNLSNGVWGSKGDRWTLILCNPAPAGKMWVNLVSSAPQAEADAHYPDHEKVGARMGEPSSTPVDGAQGRITGVRVTPQLTAVVGWANAIPDSGAWVSVVPLGTPDGQHSGNWVYTKTAVNGTYESGPLSPGEYEARFYADSQYGKLQSRMRFTVERPGAGRQLRVELSGRSAALFWVDGPADSSAWVSIVPAGTPDDRFPGPWIYTKGAAAGRFDSPPLEPGEYEARVYADRGYRVLDRIRFTVR